MDMLPCGTPFHLHTWKLNCGQTVWDKIEVLLGTSWGRGNLGSFIGILPLPTPGPQTHPRKKNPKPPPSVC